MQSNVICVCVCELIREIRNPAGYVRRQTMGGARWGVQHGEYFQGTGVQEECGMDVVPLKKEREKERERE